MCCAAAAYIIVKSHWAENTGSGSSPASGGGGDAVTVMTSAVARMVQQPQLFLLGFIQSLFESSMCAQVFRALQKCNNLIMHPIRCRLHLQPPPGEGVMRGGGGGAIGPRRLVYIRFSSGGAQAAAF